MSRMGRPLIKASAMVPGPALVMMQSEADIHSWMLFTKPCSRTGGGTGDELQPDRRGHG